MYHTQRGTSGISSGSIDALRVQLMKMNSQQLQAFAQANQDDAIKLSLAAEADKYRKQHGQEAMAMMAGQQQKPPISQQILQSIGQPPQQPQQPMPQQAMPPQGMAPQMPPQQMAQAQMPPQEMPPQQMADGGYVLPEDQGIATLPVGGMDFAEGGIIAFDDGGSTSPLGRFFTDLTTQTQTPEQKQLDALQSTLRRKRAELDKQGGLFGLQQQTPQQQEIYERTKAEIDYLENLVRNPKYVPPASTPAPALTAETKYDPATATRRSMYPEQSAPPPASASVLPKAAAKPPAAPVDPMAGLPSLKTTAISAEQAKKDAATLSNDTELRNSLAANETFVKGAYDKLLGDYDKKIVEMPEAYKSYEARLQKEEAEAETDKSKALGMSMFKAGLGMMAGTSQYAFENIGKGALVGLEDYQSALKDFKKAQRERNRAFADIEQARLAEKRGDLKTHTELQAKGIEALGMAKNRTVDGIAKIFDVDARTATGIFETGMKEASQNERSIYSARVELKKQGMSDTAAMDRVNAQVAGHLKATQMNADAFKLPILYKSVEDSVDKMLQADINYKTADEATKATIRDAALKKRLLATPGLAQYAGAATGGGGAADFVYENGQLVPRKP